MKVHNFAGFMKARKRVNESEIGDMPENEYGAYPEQTVDFGANPEEGEELEGLGGEELEGEELEGEEVEEVTMEDLKAMIEDLTDRIEALEGGGEEGEELEGEEGEELEGEEGEELEGEEGEELEGEEGEELEEEA